MTEFATQPDNKNFLSPLGFIFVLNRTPNVSYFCSSVSLPNINFGAVDQQTTFVQIPWIGDKIVYEPLSLRFKVDEDMNNYLEIFNWMVALGKPDEFEQIHPLLQEKQPYGQSGVVSDGTLQIQSNHRNTNIEVSFADMFPVSLSPLEFDVTPTTVDPLMADVVFRFRTFQFTV